MSQRSCTDDTKDAEFIQLRKFSATSDGSATLSNVSATRLPACHAHLWPLCKDEDDDNQTLTSHERWAVCARTMKQHDEEMVRGWKEDIDTLLVFAGLFSAVLTAFTVESYQTLQQDPLTEITQLLRFIAFEVSRNNNCTALSDLASTAFPGDPAFQAPASAKRINTLWFSALVCSLVVALVGILAKQWLREYLSEVSSSPRENVHLRQYRYNGLVCWRVMEIMAALPVILESSLVLFLVGLVDFLWHYDTIVALVVTLLVAISLTFYITTTVLPAFSANNPFKSPQAWTFFKLVHICSRIRPRRAMRPFLSLRSFIRPRTVIEDLLGDYDLDYARKPPINWREREIEFIQLSSDTLAHSALAWTYKSSLDDEFLDLLIPCVGDLRPNAAASLIFEMIARKGECSLSMLVESIRTECPQMGLEKFISRTGERGKARLVVMLLDLLPRMVHDTQHTQITMSDVMYTLRKLMITSELAMCELATHRRALDTLALLMEEGAPRHAQLSALNLLSAMTDMRCNELYYVNGIQNVATFAKNAIAKGEMGTFIMACKILLTRLPALRSHLQDSEWHGCTWIRDFIHNLRLYFEMRNRTRSQYNIGSTRIPWCSNLAGLAEQDRSLLNEELITALEHGVSLGLVVCESEEGDALSRLKEIYFQGI